jgi:hypothetical protein
MGAEGLAGRSFKTQTRCRAHNCIPVTLILLYLERQNVTWLVIVESCYVDLGLSEKSFL